MKLDRWILCGVFFAVLVQTNEALPSKKLPIATGEWAPYVSVNMTSKGFLTEILSEVFKEMGYEPDYMFYPWRRCYESVRTGKVWAAFPYSYTEKRGKEVMFSDNISYSLTRFFVYNRNEEIWFDSLQDLKGYKIGGVIGYFYEEAFRNAKLNVDYSAKESEAIEKLSLGRIDLLPLNELVGWYLIRKQFPNEFSNFRTLQKPYSKDDLHLIVSPSYPNSRVLMDRFNQALRRVKDNYIYKNLLDRFLVDAK